MWVRWSSAAEDQPPQSGFCNSSRVIASRRRRTFSHSAANSSFLSNSPVTEATAADGRADGLAGFSSRAAPSEPVADPLTSQPSGTLTVSFATETPASAEVQPTKQPTKKKQ